MIRLQDIADMVGVSRTTVSNVIHGNTKRVSKQTIDKITAILDEQGYVPNMGSMILTSNVSHIIGFVLGYEEIHGFNAMQDPFVGEFVGSLQKAADIAGYYVMLIDGKKIDKIVNVSSSWNIDGLVALGFTEEDFYSLKRKLNKPIVLIDTYAKNEQKYINIGIDDYSGGYQIGEYLLKQGFDKALYLAETDLSSDYYRWLGFKKAMESRGGFCSKSRYILIDTQTDIRMMQYEQKLELFRKAGALAFASDYNAMEAMNFFSDRHIQIPEEISVTGFDDNMYATIIHPRLTTVRQDVRKKAMIAMEQLLHIIHNEQIMDHNIKIPVHLVIRDSVRQMKKIKK
ncbi:MAG: LacI family DNA-binding transcriptional regulator [Lachnospiraceae bacterium]|nr:LacI family DNA-binding transcriptional regulator [Lachnospiraceae bacterium]